jgi:putative mycofactocin binding protein MftB
MAHDMANGLAYRLANDVQVRKEAWGLLFYRQAEHKVYFVRSGEWLKPEHFDGTWTLENLTQDIAKRTGALVENIKTALPKLTERLTANRMLVG